MNIITPKISKNKTEAVFYYGDEIGNVLHNKKRYVVESRGELELYIKSQKYKGDMAQKELLSLNYTNKKVAQMFENDEICLNNWFALIEVNKKGECISDDLAIVHTYDEAIEVLTNIQNYI
jgi:hypothetical protein